MTWWNWDIIYLAQPVLSPKKPNWTCNFIINITIMNVDFLCQAVILIWLVKEEIMCQGPHYLAKGFCYLYENIKSIMVWNNCFGLYLKTKSVIWLNFYLTSEFLTSVSVMSVSIWCLYIAGKCFSSEVSLTLFIYYSECTYILHILVYSCLQKRAKVCQLYKWNWELSPRSGISKLSQSSQISTIQWLRFFLRAKFT